MKHMINIILNSQQQSKTLLECNLFPPDDSFIATWFKWFHWKDFLETNATTDEGMKKVARHYNIEVKWQQYLKKNTQDNRAKDYYKLLQLVKRESTQDYVWISFVEGLHQHAVIVTCLTCSKFDSCFPPYGILFKSLTYDIGMLDKKCIWLT